MNLSKNFANQHPLSNANISMSPPLSLPLSNEENSKVMVAETHVRSSVLIYCYPLLSRPFSDLQSLVIRFVISLNEKKEEKYILSKWRHQNSDKTPSVGYTCSVQYKRTCDYNAEQINRTTILQNSILRMCNTFMLYSFIYATNEPWKRYKPVVLSKIWVN